MSPNAMGFAEVDQKEPSRVIRSARVPERFPDLSYQRTQAADQTGNPRRVSERVGSVRSRCFINPTVVYALDGFKPGHTMEVKLLNDQDAEETGRSQILSVSAEVTGSVF